MAGSWEDGESTPAEALLQTVAMDPPWPLNPPPGYGPIVPLDRARHAGLGLRGDRSFAWSARLNSVFLTATELRLAALDYPLAFIRDGRGEYLPIAILGLRAGENLFVDGEGHWRQHCYVPAYLRRHPFCVVEGNGPSASEVRRVICVQEDQLAATSTPLFDSGGEPTPAWAPVRDLIDSVESARQRTRIFTQGLETRGLFVPFDALALPHGGEQLRLSGLFRVDEEKLDALPADSLEPLRKSGELRAIYAHLLSLERFSILLDLSVAASAAGAEPG